MVIVLHNIRSLHNVGSIFRTADAAGVEKIYLCGITPSPLDQFGKPRQQLTKVSLGAEKYIEWEKAKATGKILDKLKKDKYKIFAIEQSKKSIPYNKLQASPPKADPPRAESFKFQNIALVLGNEVKGLPPSILKKADKILEIPMYGRKESLNVGVAFGVVVFRLRELYN